MKRLNGLSHITALIIALFCFTAYAQETSNNGQCNRSCLINMVDTYLTALVAHDIERVPMAPTAKFVENATALVPGAGLWNSAREVPTNFRIYVPDPVSQQVGFMGLMKAVVTVEDKTETRPVLLALRLKLENGQITEMEHLLARNIAERNLSNLLVPRRALLTAVPGPERMPHDELTRIGATYYDALVGDDGSLAPFADNCIRRENGTQTTKNPPPEPGNTSMALFGAMGCAEQLDTNVMSYIDQIDNRRVEIADVETGLVFGLSHFRHSMNKKVIKIKGVPGVKTRELTINAFDLPAAHIYKITGGMIHEIEAMGFVRPYNSPTGWE